MKSHFPQGLLVSGLTFMGLTSLGLVACGGGGGDEPTASANNVAAVGQITGFGSVIVNGTKFDTTGTSFDVDDALGSESDLDIGMVVTVYGSKSEDGTTGHADHIVYDDELEGPIESIMPNYNGNPDMKLITVLKTDVVVSRNKTVFDDDDPSFTFDSMKVGDAVEVSGYFDGKGLLFATHMEKESEHDDQDPYKTHIEIKGIVDSYDPQAKTFKLGMVTVMYDDRTDMDDLREHGKTLENGLYVEVEGHMTDTPDTVYAYEIEVEDDFYEEGEVDIEGIVSGFTDISSNFFINGTTVNAANAKFEPSELAAILSDGMLVEAEGTFIDGVLQVYELELEDDDFDDDGDDDSYDS